MPGKRPPPWSGNNDAMRDWVFYQLENFYRVQREELLQGVIDPESGDATLLELLDSSDRSTRTRGMALLRSLVSPLRGAEFADRIQWKRKRGRPKSPPKYNTSGVYSPKGWVLHSIDAFYDYRSKVGMAKRAVPIIQNLWRENYDGKWQRRSGDIDAYEIAALYYVVDVEDVRRKPSGRHKKK